MKGSAPTIAFITSLGLLGGCMPMTVASESVAPELLVGVMARRSGPEGTTSTGTPSTGSTSTGTPSTGSTSTGAPASGSGSEPMGSPTSDPAGATGTSAPAPEATPAPAGEAKPVAELIPVGSTFDNDPKEDRRQRVRKGVFWAGIILAAVGVGGTIGFGVGGRVMQAKLDDGYSDGSLTHQREDRYRDTGDLMNTLAATSAGIAVVGGIMSAVSYGIDYTACGTLAYRKRKDCTPKQRAR